MSIEASENKTGAFDRNLQFRQLCESLNISVAEGLRYLKAEAVAGRIDLNKAIACRTQK